MHSLRHFSEGKMPQNMHYTSKYALYLVHLNWPSVQLASLQWRHNDRDGVSNNQHHDFLLTQPFIQGADQRKYQSSASLAFVWGIHWWPVNSPHERPVTRKLFQFDDVIMLLLVQILKVTDWYTILNMQAMVNPFNPHPVMSPDLYGPPAGPRRPGTMIFKCVEFFSTVKE